MRIYRSIRAVNEVVTLEIAQNVLITAHSRCITHFEINGTDSDRHAGRYQDLCSSAVKPEAKLLYKPTKESWQLHLVCGNPLARYSVRALSIESYFGIVSRPQRRMGQHQGVFNCRLQDSRCRCQVMISLVTLVCNLDTVWHAEALVSRGHASRPFNGQRRMESVTDKWNYIQVHSNAKMRPGKGAAFQRRIAFVPTFQMAISHRMQCNNS